MFYLLSLSKVFFLSLFSLLISNLFPLPWCQNRLCVLVTDDVKAHLPYIACCSSLCFLSNKQGVNLFRFLSWDATHLSRPQQGYGVLFSLFLPFCLTSWLSGFTGISLSVRNSIKSFLYLDTNPVMTSCGHVFQVPPGWADRGRWWLWIWALPLSQYTPVVVLSGCPSK